MGSADPNPGAYGAPFSGFERSGAVAGPDPELDCHRSVAGDEPEPDEIFPVILRELRNRRENFWREHYSYERNRYLRDDRDVEDPLRPAHRHLDKAAGFCDRDCVRECLVRAGSKL